MTSPTISFSRSGRSGLHGKNDQRMSADVPQALLDDLDEAVARQREHVQTATRSEVLRSIVDEDLNGRIGALCHAFPGARDNMPAEAAMAAFAAMAGMTPEEYERWVIAKHVYGRLHVDDHMVAERPALRHVGNVQHSGPVSVGERK